MGMIQPVFHLANSRGRDFIVGDLHGNRKALDAMLDEVNFQPGQGDRLFAVGDLIDRGPDPMACLALLDEPWFYPVLGNHEHLLLQALEEPINERNIALRVLLENGGNWLLGALEHSLDEVHRFGELLRQQPLIRVVGSGASRFNLVHALLLRQPEPLAMYTDADIDGGVDDPSGAVMERMVWARTLAFDAGVMALWEWWQNPLHAYSAPLHDDDVRWLAGYRKGLEGFRMQPGLSLTYCGHTPMPVATILASHCFLDTGCGYSGTVRVGQFDTGIPKSLTLAQHTANGPRFHNRITSPSHAAIQL